MSELVPDHLSVMRETLSRFCDEIRSFHADHGNDLAPGSPAVHEQAASPRPQSLDTAWSQSALLIELGSEHITAFVKTITEPVEVFACLTCIRSMLEPCALASWLLDPRIDAHTRVGRTFALRYEGLEQQLKLIRTDVESENYLQEIQGTKDRIDEIDHDALKIGFAPIVNKNGKRTGIGESMPSATGVIKLMLDEEFMYRLLSAVTHGHNWALMDLALTRAPEGGPSPDVGGGPVNMFEKTSRVDYLALFGLTMTSAFAKPVWHQCNYAGWDKERLIGVLDNTFNKLGAAPTERFWHGESCLRHMGELSYAA